MNSEWNEFFEQLNLKCAWCGEPLDPESFYSVGGRLIEGKIIEIYGGKFIEKDFKLSTNKIGQRTVQLLICPKGSLAEQEAGINFLCLTCSNACSENLRTALISEEVRKN